MTAIRTSERITFKKCRRLWDYTSQNRMALEPVRMHNALSFGIDIHVGLQHYYDPNFWDLDDQSKTERAIIAFGTSIEMRRKQEKQASLGGITVERDQELDEQQDLGAGMLRHYGQWAPARDRELGLTPISVEQAIKVPIGEFQGEPVYYQARIDMVARHGDGHIYLWDYKTTASISDNYGFLDLDTQIGSYFWIYEQAFGELPKGMVYNELLKTVPKPPKQLKNGSLSKDKRQHTTLELYLKEIDRLGLDSEPYSDILALLAEKQDRYFSRTLVNRTPAEVAAQSQYIRAEVVDMLYDPSIYPNPSKMHCNGCAFLVPCMTRNEGEDDSYLLTDAGLYRPRESEDVPVANS